MASTKLNRERAACVVVDAISFGNRTAAKRHSISEKTVQRYRARLAEDPELSDLVAAKGRAAENGWHFARARFLRRSLNKLEKLVQAATVDHFEQITEAIKAVGELDVAREALGVGDRDHQPRPAAAEASTSDAAEEDEDGDGAIAPEADGPHPVA